MIGDVGVIVALTIVGIAGLVVAVHGWQQPAPTLSRVIHQLQRSTTTTAGTRGGASDRIVLPLVSLVRDHPKLLPSDAELRLVGRSVEEHVGYSLAASVAGSATPAVALGILQAVGLLGFGWFVPPIAGLLGAVLGWALVRTVALERASHERDEMRYQVSAYLDVVTMLLAGNTGYEGALEQGAHVGDGRLFTELRRRMRESGARGVSLTDALGRAGRELGLDELEQIAATAAVSAAEGAPVARTLAAKCSTLRAGLATEQESEARLRTSRLTTPIVGMALIFMGLVIYPALSIR